MHFDAHAVDLLLSRMDWSAAVVTVLTGAGISAESGIPTFRGPEGYWTVGSKVYHPQEMATLAMFRQTPEAVWQWYLYRLGVCQAARPNDGHRALVALEHTLGDRFTLITQNVDNLHLQAGQRPERTFEIHGNIFYGRCAAECSGNIYPLPQGISGKTKQAPLTKAEWELLRCPACRALLRPHVLWFDETYNEHHYRFNSALDVARRTTLLIVVGTSGSTNLPNQVVSWVYQSGGLIIDINIAGNPFSQLAQAYDGGMVIKGPSSTILPKLVECIQTHIP